MRILKELLKNIDILEMTGDKSSKISSVCFDSRKATANSLFVVIRGNDQDGRKYVEDAIKNGANTIMHDSISLEKIPKITYIKVLDSRKSLAQLAQNFYNNPGEKIKIIGVTGTNGKTTTATLLFNLFRSLGYNTALLSTVENKINDKVFPATHTTPDPISLASFLYTAISKKCQYVFMECSSHAIDQKRIYGLNFTGAIFTNLTHDHLDYHKTLESYAKAKKELFDNLPINAFAITNNDDKRSEYMLNNTKAKKYSFSILNKQSNFIGKIISDSLDGICMTINEKKINSKLIGTFNAYNLLAVFATAKLLEIPENEIVSSLEKILPPTGRLELIKSQSGVYEVVDYAHTPDALSNILSTLNNIKSKKSRIITVIGCGGDRDKTKRPIMGKIACDLSNITIFTSDNSRSEKPENIINDMTRELKNKSYSNEPNRAKAINLACNKAKPGDIVLVAGKGHENYQIFSDHTDHFSDREELEKNFKIK